MPAAPRRAGAVGRGRGRWPPPGEAQRIVRVRGRRQKPRLRADLRGQRDTRRTQSGCAYWMRHANACDDVHTCVEGLTEPVTLYVALAPYTRHQLAGSSDLWSAEGVALRDNIYNRQGTTTVSKAGIQPTTLWTEATLVEETVGVAMELLIMVTIEQQYVGAEKGREQSVVAMTRKTICAASAAGSARIGTPPHPPPLLSSTALSALAVRAGSAASTTIAHATISATSCTHGFYRLSPLSHHPASPTAFGCLLRFLRLTSLPCAISTTSGCLHRVTTSSATPATSATANYNASASSYCVRYRVTAPCSTADLLHRPFLGALRRPHRPVVPSPASPSPRHPVPSSPQSSRPCRPVEAIVPLSRRLSMRPSLPSPSSRRLTAARGASPTPRRHRLLSHHHFSW
ncbi:Protein of unknown function [Gryllus bimaculatus]|nr:Protein of unknown function [Gryllus bimaculatus]